MPGLQVIFQAGKAGVSRVGSGRIDDRRPPDALEVPNPSDEVERAVEPTLVAPAGSLGRGLVHASPSLSEAMDGALAVTRGGATADPQALWLLESLTTGGKHVRRMLIYPLPFRIGRAPGLELVLPSQQVSKQHAEIYQSSDGLRLRDLNSTNGTLVNRDLVRDHPIHEGDILHFADFEFRVARQEVGGAADGEELATAGLGDRPLPHQFSAGTRELKELLALGAVTIVFQPIVRLRDRSVVAYEALGRGRHPGLPEGPTGLFAIAESLGVAVELSRLFRRRAVELVRNRESMPTLFLNAHAAELEQAGLVESLEEVRGLAPDLPMILEINESALAIPAVIAELQCRLATLQIGLAYDDFGAGQARLIELAEVPPTFLKFDRRFVGSIDCAPMSKRRLLAALVAAARELGVDTIAEGVETAAEADACVRAGFTHAQGFFLGVPVSVDRL
jgi:EAL domain-containing protein (putative c-di-GMP-specific phosphodiesterase class I)